MTYNILDDQGIANQRPKGNLYKLVGWMFVSAIVFILVIFGLVFFMKEMHIRERSTMLRTIHEGLNYIPIATTLNIGVFTAYLLFFSQTFNRHLKEQILKTVTLSLLILTIAFLGYTIYGAMNSNYMGRKVQKLEYWISWGVFIGGYGIPTALAYYYAWEKRLQIILIAAFFSLILIQSFMMVYIYPRL